jgi:hypothetical protein
MAHEGNVSDLTARLRHLDREIESPEPFAVDIQTTVLDSEIYAATLRPL